MKKLYLKTMDQLLFYLLYQRLLKGLFLIKGTNIFILINYIMTGNMGSEKKHSTEQATVEMIDRITQE